MRRSTVKLFLLLLLVGCSDDTALAPELYSTWRLVEYGYSPGSGYNIEQVPLVPAQWLKLTADGQMQSNIEHFDLHHAHYYNISVDPDNSQKIISFYASQEARNEDRDARRFNINDQSGSLRLDFRFCFEGCHLGFVRDTYVNPY